MLTCLDIAYTLLRTAKKFANYCVVHAYISLHLHSLFNDLKPPQSVHY